MKFKIFLQPKKICILHGHVFVMNLSLLRTRPNIYIFIAIALDESIFLDVLHFPMKNIKSRDLEATPMGRGDVKTHPVTLSVYSFCHDVGHVSP